MSLADLRQRRDVAAPVITPFLRYAGPSGAWRSIWLKDETRQITGAFKYRGTSHRVRALPLGVRIVAASTGNHGLGVATAAQRCGQTTVVFLPLSTPQAKQRALAGTGAVVVHIDGDYDACESAARAYADSVNGEFVHSFDDANVIAGHRTLCAEVDRDAVAPIDAAFVPVGGGGLLAACLLHWGGRIPIVGVEIDTAPALATSLRVGERVCLPPTRGWTEGLLVRQIGATAFGLASQHRTRVVVIDSSAIRRALQGLWVYHDIRAEGAGAAALGAALADDSHPGAQCLCVVSGGNIDDRLFAELVASA
jgi:threonine dehydratase